MVTFNVLFVYGVAAFNLSFAFIYLTIYLSSKKIAHQDTLFIYGAGLFFSTFIYFIGEAFLGYYRNINLLTEMIIWQRVEHIGVYFSMFFVLFYVLRITKVIVSRKLISFTFFVVIIFVVLMLFTNFVITDEVRNFNSCTVMGAEGPLYFMTHLMLFIFVGLSYYFIIKSFRENRKEKRSGLYLVFLGLIVGSIGAIYDVLGTIVDIRFLAKVSVFSYGVFIMELFFLYELGRKLFGNAKDLYDANLKIKKQDDALVRGAKFEMMGQLVSGVLHDLRNAISFVSLSNDNLEIISQKDEKAMMVVLKQQQSIEMSMVLLDNLSSFATGKIDVGDEFSRFSPYMVIQKMEKILRGKMKKAAITFNYTVSPDLFLAGRESLFMQVIFNLFLNSLEAVKDGGKIEFIQDDIDGKELVAFNFSDNGIGLDDAIKDHIFDFLFTTKKFGSGLGLYITRNIVAASGGSIKVVDSSSGATFRILWPLVY